VGGLSGTRHQSLAAVVEGGAVCLGSVPGLWWCGGMWIRERQPPNSRLPVVGVDGTGGVCKGRASWCVIGTVLHGPAEQGGWT
jgi:hypothetical protein